MTTPAGPSPLDAALDQLSAARFSEAERRLPQAAPGTALPRLPLAQWLLGKQMLVGERVA